jgi:hypothetical protein
VLFFALLFYGTLKSSQRTALNYKKSVPPSAA